MTEIWRSKFYLGTFLTALSITLSYEIKIGFKFIPFYLLAIISFIISTYLANTLISLALKSRLGRQIVIGKSWIEGHWFLYTVETPEKVNQLTKSGIVYISYEGDNYILSVKTYRKSTNNIPTGTSSISNLATIRSFDLTYSNIFSISDGTSETKGVTTGSFFSDGIGQVPNRFEGHAVLFNEGVFRKQTATKIPQKEVKKQIKENGNNWKDIYLDKKKQEFDMKIEKNIIEK